MSRCRTCGTHIFEPGEPADADVKHDRLRAAVVEVVMLAWRCGLWTLPTKVDAACAALAAAEKEQP